MAVAPLVGVAVSAVSTVSGISQKNKQAREQREQADIQAQSVRDQRILSQFQIDEQRRQLNAASERERLLGLQQQALQLAANDIQSTQQSVASIQADIANDQAAFQNNQRATAKQAQASIQAAETMQQLQQLSSKGIEEGKKTEQEANAITAQRMLLQGAGSADTQAGQALLERVMNAVASGAINNTSVFNSEMDDAQRQLAYETETAGLEQILGRLAVSAQDQAIDFGATMNTLQRDGNRQNINTQVNRNDNARDYELASKRAQLNINQAANNTQADSQLSSISAQRNAIRGSTFGDYLGAAGNLGMSMYQAGIFGGGAGAPNPIANNPRPYSVFSGNGGNVTPMQPNMLPDTGLLSSGRLGIGGNF